MEIKTSIDRNLNQVKLMTVHSSKGTESEIVILPDTNHTSKTTTKINEVLNYMNDNIVTSHENTTAAESVIRDADMASEMTNYTKYNVLMQSAQSMLSQSNQNLGSSLDLLK